MKKIYLFTIMLLAGLTTVPNTIDAQELKEALEKKYGSAYYNEFSGGWYLIANGDYQGACDLSGKEIIAPDKYTHVSKHEDYYGVNIGDFEGVCDLNGKEIITPDKYKYILKQEGYYVVYNGDFEGACDLSGKEIVPPKYYGVLVYDSKIRVKVSKDSEYEDLCAYQSSNSTASTSSQADEAPSVSTSYDAQRSFTTLDSSDDLTFTIGGVTFTMKPVPGGTFWMGAQSTDANGQNYDSEADDDESPVHQVTLSSYYMGETEVTQALWQAVTGQSPRSGGDQWSNTYGIGNDYPAYYVSWDDICGSNGFLEKLNKALSSELGGRRFALPTEAQWEFAARGGNNSHGYKYAGSNTIGDVAWYASNSSSKTHEVGKKDGNELGLKDMSGNVWEWCSDMNGTYCSDAVSDPAGSEFGFGCVLRGGSWYISRAGHCRVSTRSALHPSHRLSTNGFRLVLLPFESANDAQNLKEALEKKY